MINSMVDEINYSGNGCTVGSPNRAGWEQSSINVVAKSQPQFDGT